MQVKPSKASVLGALSRALDLVEGQPEGHALRTFQIALPIARNLKLDDQALEDLYFACVLKDSGCSNNSVRIQSIFGGDEFLAKSAVKTIDWSSPIESIKFAFQYTEVGQSLGAKLRRMASNIGNPSKVMNEMTAARCTRGASIASALKLSQDVAEAILYLDEHWDGRGAPYQKSGEDIPLLSRVIGFAQTFEVFATAFGPTTAFQMAESRKGKWFDPKVVAAAADFRDDQSFWSRLSQTDDLTSELSWLNEAAINADLDAICEVFAMIVDAKSSFTAEHSTRVTSYAVRLAAWFGFDKNRQETLRRAGLLHDVGKLGVSTQILEKPARLDPDEFEKVKLHPMLSDKILRRIPTFQEIADIASAHHERLDGKGYWRGLAGGSLSLDVRILTVSDVFDALTAKRPYRDAMSASDALQIMMKDEGTAFDPECLRGLQECFGDQVSLAA